MRFKHIRKDTEISTYLGQQMFTRTDTALLLPESHIRDQDLRIR